MGVQRLLIISLGFSQVKGILELGFLIEVLSEVPLCLKKGKLK